MAEMDELIAILKKPHPTEKDWKRFYELRQALVNQEVIKQLDNLVEVRYMEA